MLRSYIAFDLETTGLSPENSEIIEIGALKVRDGKVKERFIEFARPKEAITPIITNLTGITNEMVGCARCSSDVVGDFLDFCEDDILVGHNIIFDYSFVKVCAAAQGRDFRKSGVDTLKIARKVHKEMESKSLSSLCEYYHIDNQSAHRAYHDALATAKLYQTLAHYFEEKEPKLFQPSALNFKPKKVEAATPKQIGLLKRLIQNNGAKVEWNPETITKSEASRLIDSILNKRQLHG